MKTLLTAVLAVFLAFSSFASEKAESLMSLSHIHTMYKKFDVHLEEGVGKAQISILNTEGQELHHRTVNAKNSLIVPYNLNALPCGEYQIMISTKDEKVLYTIETKDEIPLTSVDYPLMAYGKISNDNLLSLTVVGLEKAGVIVQFYTKDGDRLIHEEYVSQPEGFRKNFRLKGVHAGNVYVSVTDALNRNRVLFF